MSADNFKELLRHVGHKTNVVTYQDFETTIVENVAIECVTCQEVLMDYDNNEVLE